ncbi:unnamed protein product [[Candida] boidinii]|nr:unnamed protein product [[Candida] boidinii]
MQSENISDNQINTLFDKDYRTAPEYIALACLYLLNDNKNDNSENKNNLDNKKEYDVIINIMQNFIVSLLDINSPYLNSIFKKFEEFNANELGKLLAKYYEVRKSKDSIQKVSNLIFELPNNEIVINSILSNEIQFIDSFEFAISFSQFGWKNFESFIKKNLDSNNQLVLKTIIEFLEIQCNLEYENAQAGNNNTANNNNTNSTNKSSHKSLDLKTIHFLMEILSQRQISSDLFGRYKSLQALCLQAYPRLINFGRGHDEAILTNSSTNSFSSEVEKEMKMYYQKMYNNEIEIKEIISMLQRLKSSDSPHDQDVFACMIHSLLDEYRFFPEYPVDALATTSVLFGSTIFFELIDGAALSIALRYILESARQPSDSKIFKFAIQALYSFLKRLPEWPKYCTMLSEIQSLQNQPQIYEMVKSVVNGTAPPPVTANSAMGKDKSSASSQLQNQTSTGSASTPSDPKSSSTDSSNSVAEIAVIPSRYRSISMPAKIIDDVTQEVPPSEISDRVLFMVNNITEDKLDSRVSEMKEILSSKYYRWFSDYLVPQRAQLEPNNQHLYSSLINNLKSLLLDQYIQKITFYQIVRG